LKAIPLLETVKEFKETAECAVELADTIYEQRHRTE
jgi:hypothetical protein